MSALHSERTPHGVPHQLNIYKLDRDSTITARGRHKRCIVFGAGTQIQVRVDDVTGDQQLPWPTLDQVLQAAKHPHHRMHGRGIRLVLVKEEEEVKPGGVPGILACRWYDFDTVAC